MTGLSNERYFRILYDFAFAAGDRGIPLTLVLLQVDGVDLPTTSDSGDDVGERIVRTGAMLAETTREMDITAHLGQGRFLCLMMDCNLQGGMVFADRIRTLAESLRKEWGFTLSLGMATYEDGMDEPGELLETAERCLEKAREDGGDRLVTIRDL